MELTQKQFKWANCYLATGNGTDSYKKVYDARKMSENAISVEVSRLLNNPKISTYLEEQREKLNKETIMSAQERTEWLSQLIKTGCDNGDVQTTKVRLQALDILNRMTGEYVTQINANVDAKAKVDLSNVTSEDLKEMLDVK